MEPATLQLCAHCGGEGGFLCDLKKKVFIQAFTPKQTQNTLTAPLLGLGLWPFVGVGEGRSRSIQPGRGT